MFEIGFWELVFISIIALFVFGPERLPDAIRTVSKNIRSVKNMMDGVKSELSREISAQEVRNGSSVITVNESTERKPSGYHTRDESFAEEAVITESAKSAGNHS